MSVYGLGDSYRHVNAPCTVVVVVVSNNNNNISAVFIVVFVQS
jgi:hypothetical protein